MRNDMNRQRLLDKRVQRLALIETWIASTDDTYLLSELLWLKNKISAVRKPPKDPEKLQMERNLSHAINRRIEKENPGGESHYKSWSPDEDQLVISSDLRDVDLAKKLGRSYVAIGARRTKLRKSGLVPSYNIDVVPESTPDWTHPDDSMKDTSVLQSAPWPLGMLQDDSYPLAHWLSSKPDARQHVRDVAGEIERERGEKI